MKILIAKLCFTPHSQKKEFICELSFMCRIQDTIENFNQSLCLSVKMSAGGKMMTSKIKSVDIHQVEMLLTLDYLLHYTDENHPATQIDICEHAKEFGLKYDKNAEKGNQVRRQRISKCLKLLDEISDSFPEKLPFVLEKTDSGKYYVEQRNGVDEQQIAKILAAITNDKYTKDEDVSFLKDRVLSAFSTSEENKNTIELEYKSLLRGVKKLDKKAIEKNQPCRKSVSRRENVHFEISCL